MSKSEADEENRAEESGPVNTVCERIQQVQTPQDLTEPGTGTQRISKLEWSGWPGLGHSAVIVRDH